MAKMLPDLKYWGESELLLSVEDISFANDKIGPGAPPIKTKAGCLATAQIDELIRLCLDGDGVSGPFLEKIL